MTGTMIVDDVEGFLRFLDNASFQLACLLDLDGQRSTSKKSINRQKSSLTQASTKATRISRPRALNSSNQTTTTKRQHQIKLQRPTRAKGRRKGSANTTATDISASELDQCQQQHLNEPNGSFGQQQQHHQLNNNDQQEHHNQHPHHQHHQALTTSNGANYELNQSQQQHQHHQNHHQHHPLSQHQHHHHHHQQQADQLAVLQSKLQHLTGNSETHTLDGQLTLGITDELPLDHGSSISPATHLSPMDSSSIQFNPVHQQHYYPNQRGGHLDSYHIHDEFTSHDQIPITNASSSSHIGQEPIRQVSHQQHLTILGSHQQQQSEASMRADNIDSSTLSSPANCYSAQHSHHMHQQQPQHHQQAQQQQQQHHQQQRHQHHHHQTHYHQLDQQWLGGSTHTADSTLNQLSAADSSALDYAAPLSPVTHQSLDQVQFNTPLYHHSYYNSQSEQLDSFQQIGDEYATNSSPLTTVSSSSPIGHIHRMQQDPQQQQQHHHHHHHQQQQQQTQQQSQAPHHQQQLRMPPLDVNNGSSGTSNSYDQHTHHSHHAQLESHQMQTINTSYNSHNHHHSHQHQHNQMMPLMNGLESNGVILQDINLASASWSSPEDLYSI